MMGTFQVKNTKKKFRCGVGGGGGGGTKNWPVCCLNFAKLVLYSPDVKLQSVKFRSD